MNTSSFEKNIRQIYGKEGESWLLQLPQTIEKFQSLWGVTDLSPLDNLSHNYVLEGKLHDETLVILKLCPDIEGFAREMAALKIFQGYGAIPLIAGENGALLMERAVPGTYLPSEHKALETGCHVMNMLHFAPLPRTLEKIPHISEWLSTLDQDWNIPKDTLSYARKLKDQLLGNIGMPLRLLHGDLHRKNILLHKKNWLAIDPKGVVGFPINEVWAMVEDPRYDLPFISRYFDFKYSDVVSWYYVHVVLAACWSVQDNLDPRLFLDVAKVARSMMLT